MTITEQSSCDLGLIFAQTVNGSPYSGMGVINKLHEGIVPPFADVVGSRASSQGDVMDVPDGRLIGRWHPLTRIGGTDPSGCGGGCMRRYPPDTCRVEVINK